MYLDKKYSYKNVFPEYDVNIDGKVYNYKYIDVLDFPFNGKSYNFYKDIRKEVSCYKVKYIKVKILFIERRFVYDLIDWYFV